MAKRSLIWSLPVSPVLRALLADSVARRAFKLGVRDGLRAERECDESYIGMTWAQNQDANETYDAGANLGQRLGRVLMRATDAPFQSLDDR